STPGLDQISDGMNVLGVTRLNKHAGLPLRKENQAVFVGIEPIAVMAHDSFFELACRHLESGQVALVLIQGGQRFERRTIAQLYWRKSMIAGHLHQPLDGEPMTGVQAQSRL